MNDPDKLETKATAHLQSLPWERRPKMANGFRVKSVATASGGYMEVTTDHGHIGFAPTRQVLKWLQL